MKKTPKDDNLQFEAFLVEIIFLGYLSALISEYMCLGVGIACNDGVLPVDTAEGAIVLQTHTAESLCLHPAGEGSITVIVEVRRVDSGDDTRTVHTAVVPVFLVIGKRVGMSYLKPADRAGRNT